MSSRLGAITPLDWGVVALYGALVVAAALVAQRRQRNSDDYLMGGRSLPWWLLGVSIIATAFSSISLLGWTGKGYVSGAQWFQLQAGELAAIVVVCVLFLPFFSGRRLTTAYEYLESRFGPRARWLASALFHVQVLARAGLFLYLTARALSVFTDVDVEVCIVIVGLAAMIYSCAGGLGAVVWTDAVQLLLVVSGLLASIVLILGELPGGAADVWAVATAPERPPMLQLDPDPGLYPSFWTGLLAYGVLALSVAGTGQQHVQRYMACRDLARARRAALLSWGLGALIVLLTLALGVALFARYDGRPIPADDVFTTFVRDGLPTGLAGVMVAAIFAASMSSIDSAIHALSTATLVDFVERVRGRPLEERPRLRLARSLTLGYGVLGIGAAFYALSQGTDVIDLLLAWLGFLGGPVLGLFLVGMLTRAVAERHALLGVLGGYGAAVLFQGPTWWQGPGGAQVTLAAHLGLDPIWSAGVGCGATCAVALVLRAAWPAARPSSSTGSPPGNPSSA